MVLRALVLVLAVGTLAGCSLAGDEPYPESDLAFLLFVRGGETPTACNPEGCGWSAEAVVESKTDTAYGHGVGAGAVVRLMLPDRTLDLYSSGLSATEIPLRTGQTYQFDVGSAFFGLGAANPVGVRVGDAEGLVFYGGSAFLLPGADETSMGRDRLPLLPEGWAVRFEPTNLEGNVQCATEEPVVAVVTSGAESVRLRQGERSQLGRYDVLVRSARRLRYDGSCLDGYQHEFSLVLARRAA